MWIKLEDCKHGGLYKIHARNFSLGVFDEKQQGFVGIREKFGDEYLFVEYHWDTGAPYGTVKPNEFIKMCSIKNLNTSIKKNKIYHTNKKLFEWLKSYVIVISNS